jgi:hypothetical protein
VHPCDFGFSDINVEIVLVEEFIGLVIHGAKCVEVLGEDRSVVTVAPRGDCCGWGEVVASCFTVGAVEFVHNEDKEQWSEGTALLNRIEYGDFGCDAVRYICTHRELGSCEGILYEGYKIWREFQPDEAVLDT